MGTVKFIRGSSTNYNIDLYKDSIYFCVDTKEIKVNNISYGNSGKSLLYNNGTLTVTFQDSTSFSAIIPDATPEQNGLLITTDKEKIDKLLINGDGNKFLSNDGIYKEITKSLLGLDNVTNDSQVKRSEMGVAGGVATLDSNGKVPHELLPTYTDDVIDIYAEYDVSETGKLSNIRLYNEASHTTMPTGELGKIFVDVTPNNPGYQFRWNGTDWTHLSSDRLVLGEIPETAADGNIVYRHRTNTEIHITAAERESWNNKLNSTISTCATGSDCSEIIRDIPVDKTITLWILYILNHLICIDSRITTLTDLFNSHTHNGVDSQLINYNNILNTPEIPTKVSHLENDLNLVNAEISGESLNINIG